MLKNHKSPTSDPPSSASGGLRRASENREPSTENRATSDEHRVTKIIVLLGPTASGKTELGIHLAKKFNGEIINADSRQVYRGLNIGTAKPGTSSFQGIGHHLFDICEPTEHWDASLFQKKADEAIVEIVSRNRRPIIVGGTGLHIKALLFGFFEGPPASSEVREELERRRKTEGLHRLHEELQQIDPEAAARIHPNDPTRVIRALEVFKIAKKPITEFQKEHQFRDPRYDYLKIGLRVGRDILYDRINRRVERMVEAGLEEEVRGLVGKGDEVSSMTALQMCIGYKEWLPYFQGKITKEEVIAQIQQNTRNFAKRQLTWFRKEKDISWFEVDDLVGVEGVVRKYLGSVETTSLKND